MSERILCKVRSYLAIYLACFFAQNAIQYLRKDFISSEMNPQGSSGVKPISWTGIKYMISEVNIMKNDVVVQQKYVSLMCICACIIGYLWCSYYRYNQSVYPQFLDRPLDSHRRT